MSQDQTELLRGLPWEYAIRWEDHGIPAPPGLGVWVCNDCGRRSVVSHDKIIEHSADCDIGPQMELRAEVTA